MAILAPHTSHEVDVFAVEDPEKLEACMACKAADWMSLRKTLLVWQATPSNTPGCVRLGDPKTVFTKLSRQELIDECSPVPAYDLLHALKTAGLFAIEVRQSSGSEGPVFYCVIGKGRGPRGHAASHTGMVQCPVRRSVGFLFRWCFGASTGRKPCDSSTRVVLVRIG